MPMDLLDVTEDSSLCNSTLMNQAHALGVSVGEARRAIARVQCRLPGITTEALFLVCLYRSTTVGCQQAVQISITTVEVTSGKAMHKQHL